MGATPQQTVPQTIALNTLAAARTVFAALQAGDSTKTYGLYAGLSQWYEDLEKNVLGRADIHTLYLHTLYKALLAEIFNIGSQLSPDVSRAISAFSAFYIQLFKDSLTATSFAVDPPQHLEFLGGLGISDLEYE